MIQQIWLTSIDEPIMVQTNLIVRNQDLINTSSELRLMAPEYTL